MIYEFLLSLEEKEAFTEIVEFLSTNGKNITSTIAVPFLLNSMLSKEILREIWTICDLDQTGTISNERFNKVLKLVALSQSGNVVDLDLINKGFVLLI